jgi:hypothetical protein
MSFLSSSEVDPAVRGGGKILFDKEIPLSVKQDGSLLPPIPTHVRVIVGGADSDAEPVRIELTTDSDLHFLYEAEFTEEDYASVQSKQGLDAAFAELPGAVIDLVNLVVTEGQGYSVHFEVVEESGGRLIFNQQLKFKLVEIMAIDLSPSSDENVREQIQYRFNTVKSELKAAQTELGDLYAMLKIKNPSALKPTRSPRK